MNAGRKPHIFSNERTSASAGSGKTHALTTRFIALALRERTRDGLPDPACITALTFTRKSAGEFLSKILTRLAEATRDEAAADRLLGEIKKLSEGAHGMPAASRKDIGALLKELIKNLNRLHLGTIDSFCSSMLGAYSPELGIYAKAEIMDEFRRKSEESNAIESILAENSVGDETFEKFAETIRRASFGLEEKSLKKLLGGLVESAQKIYLEVPGLGVWGDPSILKGSPPKEWDKDRYAAELAELEAELLENPELQKPLASAVKFFKESNAHVIGNSSATVKRLSELYRNGELCGEIFLPYNRKEYAVPPGISGLLSSLFTRLLDAHILRFCGATKALGEIAQIYEKHYAANVRGRGLLTFDDIPLMLTDPEREIDRLLLEQRLDAKFRHWMFDEFQDTSRRQWEVFKSIIDEAVSDGDRTFYYVGDVKQSLYSWRGGDHRLFNEIFEYYNTNAKGVIEEGGELYVSWRSGENVIGAVNEIFKNEEDLASSFTPNAASAFLKMFTPHVSAESLGGMKKKKASYAALSLVDGGRSSEEAENICDGIFEILKETRPTDIGKSCAILVNDNAAVRDMVEGLRRRAADAGLDLPVAGELETNISRGNLIVPPFMQILKKISHFSDTAAGAYLDMTPAGGFAENFGDAFIKKSLEKISARGFEGFAREYCGYIKDNTENLTEFDEGMMRNLADAAREFDAGADRNIDNFLAFLGDRRVKSGTAENTVQVMTIHKSKGLGFSMVILPDLHNIKASIRGGLKYVCGETFEGGRRIVREEGVLLYPSQAVCALNQKLWQNTLREKDDEAFEAICKLYVAITRAEEAMYFVIPRPSKYETKPEDASIKQILINALIPELRDEPDAKARKEIWEEISARREFSTGDRNWHKLNVEKEPGRTENTIHAIENPALSPRPHRQSAPSRDGVEYGSAESRRAGSAIHGVFEKISDISENPEAAVENAMDLAGIPSGERAAIKKAVMNNLRNPQIAKYFSPGRGVEIFNELPFTIAYDGKTVSGAIDKLALKKDEKGNAVSATVLDFKSGSEISIENAGPQLEAYKNAVSELYGLPPENVDAKIIDYGKGEIIGL